ncbi:hypothetical protein C8J57DRAFT_1521268 [Mycena rebaudengoi]|nr:hypothetical protein C8J57DRAFT_1521268 [Mycena rebaudengoi]
MRVTIHTEVEPPEPRPCLPLPLDGPILMRVEPAGRPVPVLPLSGDSLSSGNTELATERSKTLVLPQAPCHSTWRSPHLLWKSVLISFVRSWSSWGSYFFCVSILLRAVFQKMREHLNFVRHGMVNLHHALDGF